MTVSAQHFKVLQIGAPVFDPTRPRPLAIFGPHLLVRFQMVQLKNPNVRHPASCARTSEVGDDLGSGAPMGFLLLALVDRVLAFGAAIAGNGRLAAAKALAAVIPSAGRVAAGGAEAGLVSACPAFLDIENGSAKLASSVLAFLGAVCWQPFHALVPSRRAVSPSASGRAILSAGASREGGPAFGASVMDRFHEPIIAQEKQRATNFEIACRRVDDAARQPDLFIAQEPKPEQTGMDL